MNRRAFILLSPMVPIKPKPVQPLPVVAYGQEMESDILYVYRNDRFQSMYMVSDNPPGKAVVVRHRVDWYDPITQDTRTKNDSMMYIIGTEDF
jgi:hypothetical protein